MKLINVDGVESIEVANDNGTVFIGTKVWVPHTNGATFPQADLAEAKAIAERDTMNAWENVLAWATAKGYNTYYANMLAGHCWAKLI
jgi:hypothetical protein